MIEPAKTIDFASAIQLPDSLPQEEKRIAATILNNAVATILPYDGDFKADWLLSKFPDDLWLTTNNGRETFRNDSWSNTANINWSTNLPDGKNLTDNKYKELLTILKKASWLLRSGYGQSIVGVKAWQDATITSLLLVNYLVLHEGRYLPAKYAFGLLDQNGLDQLFREIAQGGWFEALQVPQRFITLWHIDTFGGECPTSILDNPFSLAPTYCSSICEWAETKGLYETESSGKNKGRRFLSRTKIAAALDTSTQIIRRNKKASAFLRQFEPDFNDDTLLLPVHLKTEYPSQKTITIRDALDSSSTDNTLKGRFNTIMLMLSMGRHFNSDSFPDSSSTNPVSAYKKAIPHTTVGNHHLFMPVNTGLSYLNEAIKFVHCYGDKIVDNYLSVLGEGIELQGTSYSRSIALKAITKRIVSTSFPAKNYYSPEPLKAELGIQQLNRRGSGFDYAKLRAEPTLTQALSILIGACTVLIAILKPSRAEELITLRRDCLRKGSDGYYLRFKLGKSNTGEAHQEKETPIPYITAKAIEQLQRLGRQLKAVSKDTGKQTDALFYLPSNTFGKATRSDESSLNTCIDLLCDYVGIAPDHLGRRWYARIHEMRKWFILLLFWAGRYDVLDAVRMIAGHVNAEHTWAYIEANFPGEELPALEAQYSVERLRALDNEQSTGQSDDGLNRLYEKVCSHFNVKELSFVPESDWIDYVEMLRKENGFKLEPHSVYADNGTDIIGIDVSFVLAETSQ